MSLSTSPLKARTDIESTKDPPPAVQTPQDDLDESQPIYPDSEIMKSDDATARPLPRGRFLYALVFSLLVYTVPLFATLLDFAHHHRLRGVDETASFSWPADSPHLMTGWLLPSWPSQPEWKPINSCQTETDWQNDFIYQGAFGGEYSHHSKMNITLNSLAPHHLFVAQGTRGLIRFTINSPQDDVNSIMIDIIAHSHSERDRDSMYFCKIAKPDASEGIGISAWAPWPRMPPNISLEINVYLPRQSFKKFETDLPRFHHWIHDLPYRIEFEELKLKSSYAQIISQPFKGIRARRASIKTSNAPIYGLFRASEELRLETVNDYIDADVNLLSPPNSLEDTVLYMKARNISITSTTIQVLLHSNWNNKAGRYRVITSTSNAKIHLDIASAPPLSQISINSETTNAPNRVILPTSYEGSFSAMAPHPYNRVAGWALLHQNLTGMRVVPGMYSPGDGRSVNWEDEDCDLNRNCRICKIVSMISRPHCFT